MFATSKFKLKDKADYLYVKYAVDEVSVFAIDDVRLVAGSGGTEIDLGGGDTPGPEPVDPTHLVLDFTRGADMATPAFPYHDKDDSSSATEGTYTIDGYTYTIKASSDGKFYWFYNNYNAGSEYKSFYIGKAGAYIELPAVEGKALTKVVLTGASGASSTSEASVTDTAGADIAGGLSQVVGQGTATYELSGTAANTSYRITITKNNCQFAKIELFYGDGGQTPTPSEPTLAVDPTSLSFAAKDSAKTIACTAANADGYTVGAESSDAANFPAAVSGTTVTVTPTENTGSARSATVTVYLTKDGGATRVAAKSVAVTQAAAGGTEPSGKSVTMTNVQIIENGTTTIPENSYGSQNVSDPATYYKWTIDGLEFGGAKICKAPAGNYTGLIQMQGNAKEAAKQGFLGNATALGKITKVVIVSNNTTYEPTEHLYMGTSAYTLKANEQTRTSISKEGNSYTETFEISGDFGFFTLANDKVGAFYVESITVYYE